MFINMFMKFVESSDVTKTQKIVALHHQDQFNGNKNDNRHNVKHVHTARVRVNDMKTSEKREVSLSLTL